MKTTINVTCELIDNGERCDCNKCAIALALQALPGVVEATVSDDGFDIKTAEGKRLWAPAPDEAAQFINDFDAGRIVSPIKFDVDFIAI